MVTKWGGLAFTNTPLTPERTAGLCWRIWGWLHAVHPPSLAGFALGAVFHPPLLCTDRKAQLQPAPCHGNNLPPAASISRAAFYCLINMHYAQPIKARAACSSLLYSSENTELTGTAPHCQEGCWGVGSGVQDAPASLRPDLHPSSGKGLGTCAGMFSR